MPVSVTNTFSNGTTADASQVNTNFTDLVNFVNNSTVHKDGSVAMSGLLTLHSADPTNANHATRKSYVDDQDKKAILVRQGAELTFTSSSATTENTATVIGTVTVADPGYDYYVWGHASLATYVNGATGLSVWSLGIFINGSLVDRLDVPFVDSVGMSIGVPLRSTARSGGAATTVTARVWRQSGTGSLFYGGNVKTNFLQVYSAKQ